MSEDAEEQEVVTHPYAEVLTLTWACRVNKKPGALICMDAYEGYFAWNSRGIDLPNLERWLGQPTPKMR